MSLQEQGEPQALKLTIGSIDFTHEFDGIELVNLRAEIDDYNRA